MKNEIYKYLQESQRPIKRPELLGHMQRLGYEITDRKLRSTIEEMITQKDSVFCVESSEKGYSIIRTQEDLDRAKEYLQNKIEALCIRRNSLERNFNTMQEAKSEPILKDNQFIMFP